MTGRIKNKLSDGFIPFLEFWSRIESRSWFLINRVKAYSDLQVENTDLRKELSELSVRVAQNSELERENKELRSMLNFKNRSELKLMSAKVIGRDPSNWWNTVMIDRGTSDGISRDMPVLTVEGLVGKTIEVTENNAQVLLIVDENCKVSGWMRESGQYGIVQGNILSGGVGSQCRMTFVDRYSKVKVSDEVFTSGLGGIFPKGVLIGHVTSVTTSQEPLKGALYQDVNISPAVDLARIDEVFIGIGLKPIKPIEVIENKNASTKKGAE
jgi:rod shape-determining protein MreC